MKQVYYKGYNQTINYFRTKVVIPCKLFVSRNINRNELSSTLVAGEIERVERTDGQTNSLGCAREIEILELSRVFRTVEGENIDRCRPRREHV